MKLKKGWVFALMFSFIMSAIYCPNMSKTKSKKVTLNKTKVSLEKKQKYTLKLKGVKNGKVKWSSSNKKVAAVKKGVVSAKKAGKCVVTAKYAKKKYKCMISVVKSKEDATNTKDTGYSANKSKEDATNTKDTGYSAIPSHTPAPSVNEPPVVPDPSEGNDYNFNFSTIHDFSDVPMEVQYVSEENVLSLKISNNSGTDISTDEYFGLEFYDGSQWISVDFKDNTYFPNILLIIKNGTDYTQRIYLGKYFASLGKGKYRISKQIMAANKGIIKTEFIIN